MSDRIQNRRTSPPVPGSTPISRPTTTVDLQQAESDFQSLLAGDDDTQQHTDVPRETSRRDDQHGGQQSPDGQEQGEDSAADSRPLLMFGDEGLPEEGVLPSPEAILNSLNSPETVSATAEGREIRDDLNQVVHQVADEVLVTDLSGQREVRITLKDSIIADTEVRLSVDQGRLQVRLVTDNLESHRRITAFQTSLQTILNERLSGQDVQVTLESDGQMFGGDPQGQSRGRGEQQSPADAAEADTEATSAESARLPSAAGPRGQDERPSDPVRPLFP